jgi:hypothetical protein
MGHRAIVAVDGTDGRQRGWEQASLGWQRGNRGQPSGSREHHRGVIELKTRAVSATSSLATAHIVL